MINIYLVYHIQIYKMSKSFKKTSITGNAFASSEKKDKRIGNRMYRRAYKQCNNIIDNEDFCFLDRREKYNLNKRDKDGKNYFYISKDGQRHKHSKGISIEEYLKLMRK